MSRTPGPWACYEGWDDHWVVIAPDGTGCLAETINYPNSKEDASFIVLACNNHDALVEALKGLVKVNEEWNASVREIVQQPDRPLFSDEYLKKARAVLAAVDKEAR